jgi:hypothetical protein
VVVEDFTVGPCRRWNCPAGKTCHDLQQNRGVIFRLRLFVLSLDTDTLKYLAKTRERAPMEETR